MDATACEPSFDWVVHCDGSAVPNPGRMGLGLLPKPAPKWKKKPR